MSDEFEFDFDSLTPEDFLKPVETAGIAVPFDPTQSFDDFVSGHVSAVRKVFARQGWVNMQAYLVAGDSQWCFGPIPPEDLDGFRDRVRTEAQRLDARMLFINRRTTGGLIYVPEDEMSDPGSPEAYQRVRDAGVERDVVFYFAHCKGPNTSETRHGLMDVLDDRLSPPEEVAADFASDYYGRFLG